MLDAFRFTTAICDADKRVTHDQKNFNSIPIWVVVKTYEDNFGKVAAYDSVREAWNL